MSIDQDREHFVQRVNVCAECPLNTLCPPCICGPDAKIGWRDVVYDRGPSGFYNVMIGPILDARSAAT